MNKKILIHCRKTPYGNSLPREAIDIALACAAFEQEVSLLFSSDGIFQLLQQQHSQLLPSKNHGKALSALPLYGIDKVYICYESLVERQLSADQLLIDTIEQNSNDIATLLDNQDVILNF